MLMRHTALILFSGLFIAASALAQDGTQSGETEAPPPAAVGATGSGTTDPGTTANVTSSFDQLPPGNRKIVEALYAAQPEVAPEGSTLMTHEQIADYKASGMGMGQIFKKMQADGLTTTKNLGMAVSKYNHQQETTTATGGETAGTGSGTTGSGTSGSGTSGSDTSGSDTTETAGATDTGAAVESTEHFDQLSHGNQKIVEAIQAGQTDPEYGLTKEQIAMLKQDMGWGHVFRQTDSKYKNLGEAISGHKHGELGISPGSEVVVTTGSGQKITVGGKKKSSAATSSADGKTKSKGHKSGAGKGVHVTTAGGGHGPVSTAKGAGKTHVTTANGSSSSGIVTGAGAASSGVIHGGGGGNAYGHAKAGK